MRAVGAAQIAFKTWSKTTVVQRREILLKASDLLNQTPSLANEWAETWWKETGETLDPSLHPIAAPISAEMIRDVAGRIAGAMCGSVPQCLDPARSAMVVKEPLGVCLGISPWNVPQALAVRAVVSAIAAGNTVVLKGSELAPKGAWQVGKLFRDAGLPDGVLNVVITRREDSQEAVQRMIDHPAVRHVNFTGSSAVGRIIAGMAGRALKPCLLELGGKGAAIILEDADVSKAAPGTAYGAFYHCGQVCMSTERVLVHESIKDAFLQVLGKTLQAIKQDNGYCMSSETGAKKYQSLVSDAVGKGAQVLFGSPDKPSAELKTNAVVLGDLDSTMDLYYAESFGPQLSVFTFKTEAEAIALANDSKYGLTTSVFSKDVHRAIKVARQIDCGAVHINTMTSFDDPSFAHGGTKDSGFGRFNAQYGMSQFLKDKTISWVDA